MLMAFILLLQAAQIVEPYTFREDEGQTTKIVLKNGLTVILREQQAVPLTSITTYVKAGYFDEEDRISGISHVIEHMPPDQLLKCLTITALGLFNQEFFIF